MPSVMQKLTARQLIDHCSKRPPEEPAWREFIRRFHPTIQKGITDVCARLYEEDGIATTADQTVIQELTQDVYKRLTRNNSEALRQVKANSDDSMKNYLLLICMNVVRDYIRGPVRNEGLRYGRAVPRFVSAFGFFLGHLKH